ncbi:MAG TPA: TMEM43 family protein [Thermoanaerobaculia bacterium]|nr:TMEM43 family protein [Thermoanaerobaculia bacterium]
MVTTEVTSQSWFGRIGNSIKSFLFGIVLFIAAFPVLWWNEGRAVRTEKSLHEGQGAVISVPADRVDPANNQKLVHMTGKATTTETLTDPDFLVAANAIKLRRHVEMYQWQEKKSSETRKKVGGGSETVTTYSYEKAWSDRPVDSASFKEAGEHQNPPEMPYQSRDAQAEHVTLGAFALTPSLLDQMSDYEAVPVTDQSLSALSADLKAKLKAHNNAFYLGADPQTPQIGDVKITFSAVTPAEVSVISKQTGTSFEPYKASAGMDIEMLKRGAFTAQQMFQQALQANTVMTWILRVVGFVLMFIGLAMFFKPISVVGDVLPIFGSMLAFGTGLFAFVVSAVLSVGTIGVAWVFYRPVLGIALLAVAIGALVWLAVSGKKKAAATAMAPATAH